ncbi:right-handed parallel beta-helix repeat-containing protein [Candidatus Bathyarchaeota archaeon]|nr:right-handed parallel beta-helix repeat-containing protein [Candidatus Bathyarchaeota archaeon]
MKSLIPNRKVLAVFVIVMFTLSALLVVAPVRASSGTLYVDIAGACEGNTPCYTHPQDAVNFANPGDTILVYPGTYDSRRFTSPVPPHWGPGDQYAPALIVWKNGLTIKAVDPDPSKTVIQTTYNFWVNKALPGGGGGGSIEHSTGCIWNPTTKVWDDDPATPGDCVRPTSGTAPNGIAIIANDVTIDGFTIISTYGGDPKCPSGYPNTGGVFVGALYAGDKTVSGISGTTISNSIIRGYSGVRIWKAPHTTLENNEIDNNILPPTPTPPYYAGCTADPTPAQVVVEAWEGWNEGANIGSTYLRAVNNHIIDYKRTSGIAVGGFYNGPVDHSGLYIHDNAIEGAASAIKLWNSQSGNIEISSNTITDSKGGIDLGSGGVHDSLIDANYVRFASLGPWGHGINGDGLNNVILSHNDIQGNPNGWAIAIFNSLSVQILNNKVINNVYGIAVVNSKGVVAHCNDIVGNGAGFLPAGPYPAMFNSPGTGDPTQYVVDATVNWWGDATGPYHPTLNPGGLGNPVSDNVQFVPWKGPVADPDGPYSGYAYMPTTFDASGSHVVPSGTIVLYEWDWDSNGIYENSTTSPTITHTWYSDFTGPVKLQVTDDLGRQATATTTVTVVSANTLKQDVLGDLTALRETVSDKEDGKKLDEAIKHLTKSLDPELWVDATHLKAKHGDKVFQEEKDAVVKLLELIKDKKSNVDKAKLQDFINRLVEADKLLALVAIEDAVAASGDAKKIDKANDELGKGDARVADGHFTDAIEHYRNAWKHAIQSV